MNLLILLVVVVVTIGLPIAYSWRLWRLDHASQAAWLAIAAESTLIVALVMILGRWDITGYYSRYALAALFAASLALSWHKHRRKPWRAADDAARRRGHRLTMISLVLLVPAFLYIGAGLLPAQEPRALAFPLRGGWFAIAQGGGNKLLNHHSGHVQQNYAADITALNDAGFRARGLLPPERESYAIFGAEVVSPCTGMVIDSYDGLPDLFPPETDRQFPPGNHVVVACDGIHVTLAHLMSGSVMVKRGDVLEAGEPIARAGNSGNTTEPHLHIHAVDAETGQAVPMSFGGRIPVRNKVFRR